MNIDPVISLALRGAFSLLFATAVLHKMRSPKEFRRAVRGYLDLLWSGASAKAPAVALLAASVIAAEIGVVVLLIGPADAHWRVAGCSGLLCLYAVLMSISLASGRSVECGCDFGAARQEVRAATVVRNLLLAAGAGLMLLPPTARDVVASDVVLTLAVVTLTSVAYQTVNQILANASNLRGSS